MSDDLCYDAESQRAREAYIADLERRLERSQQEIVLLTQRLLEARATPRQVERRTSGATELDDETLKDMFRIMAMSLHLTRVPIVMRFGFFRKRHRRRLIRALREARFIDAEWYKRTYPIVAQSGEDPEHYFVTKGIAAGHSPHPRFASEASK